MTELYRKYIRGIELGERKIGLINIAGIAKAMSVPVPMLHKLM